MSDKDTSPANDADWHALLGDGTGWAAVDDQLVERLIGSINARVVLADERLLVLLRILYGAKLPACVADDAAKAILGFRYSMEVPGKDAMVQWTENRRLSYAVCEYLAGNYFPDRIFTADGRTGERHARDAQLVIQSWLGDRFRFGFSEWLSDTCLAVNVAALTLLIDHCDDEDLATRAAMVLDLILLDAALLSFEGTLGAVAARGHLSSQVDPAHGRMAPIMASAFGPYVGETAAAKRHQPVDDTISSIFVNRTRYQVPPVLVALGQDQSERQVLMSQGLDVDEVPGELRRHPDLPRRGQLELVRFWWEMQALTTPTTISATLDVLDRAGSLDDLPQLAPLRKFRKVPEKLRPAVFRHLNPITAGMAVQRGNIQMFRTPHYQLSSVQRYHPGEFGDQQHLWHARLLGGINVFGTHPGSTMLAREVRDRTPSEWVGNGINPDLAQDGNILLSLNDLRGKRGYLEGQRFESTHIHFPFVDFDQTRMGSHWVAGRSGMGFIAIIGTNPLEQVSEVEVVQRGVLTGYAVVMADDEEFGTMPAFVRYVKEHRLRIVGQKLVLTSPYGDYELTPGGAFKVGGVLHDSWYPRYQSAAVNAPRNPRVIEVEADGHRLRLDWDTGTRTVD